MISVLIPARNEVYLPNTVADLLLHAEGEIEIVIGLDGWDCEIPSDPRVVVHKEPVAIGQRAITNKLAKLAKGEWLMKCDAHCSFSQGFDLKLLKDMTKDTIMAPALMRLDAERWRPKPKPVMGNYVFGTNFIQVYAEKQDTMPITETMCLQGSCWLVHRDKYFELDLCEEKFGSWGCQGIEISLKYWLSGGRVVTNRNCYYAHLFRNDEEFPYQRDMEQVKWAYEYCKKRFGKDIAKVVKKFNYPLDWTDEALRNVV